MTALLCFHRLVEELPKPLIEIDLTKCTWLTALPDEIGELTTLTSLILTQCSSLAALPAAIGELSADDAQLVPELEPRRAAGLDQ